MHVYFSGIGGVGIGPLAQLALDAGYEVSGSDLHGSELTQSLQAQGVDLEIGPQTDIHIKKVHQKKPIDWFVHTSALPKDHAELSFAEENKLKTSKRGEFLNAILKDKKLKLVAIAGTHGKTTTTGMIIWLFKQLGIPVSYSVGTTLSFGPAAQYQKGSEYFIYECDEFDRNFLDFQPDTSVIVSIDYDHPDTYPTKEDYFAAFSQFASQSKLCITWESIAEKLNSDNHLFVVAEGNDLSEIKLAGHNRQNAWLAATAVNRLGLVKNDLTDWRMLMQKISTFPGTNRRFEKLAENLYTDYAHHPTEIASTIKLARELNPNVVVVYQPHQNIRQHDLLKDDAYQHCFDDAEKVYWLPTYLSREYQKLDTLAPEQLIAPIKNNSHITAATMDDMLWQIIQKHLTNGDLVVGMAAGDLDAWLRQKALTV